MTQATRSPEKPGRFRREGISFFGELGLLQSLSAVARAKRSTVSARLFDLAPAATKSETKTRRKRQNHVH